MKRMVRSILAALLVFGGTSGAMAASADQEGNKADITQEQSQSQTSQSSDYQFPITQKVKLSSNSYAQLTDLNLFKADDHNLLTYTVLIYNGDQKPIELLDYWVRVKNRATGTAYSSTLATADRSKSRVLSNSSVTLRFFSRIDKNAKLENLSFEVVRWDFSLPDYTRRLGEIAVPKGFSPVVSPIQYKTTTVNGVPIKLNLYDYSKAELNDSDLYSITLQLENVGNQALASQAYKYYLKSDDGMTYPLSVSATQDLSLQPRQKKMVTLGASVPRGDTKAQWVLQINQVDETAKTELGIATFRMPDALSDYNLAGMNEEKVISVGNKKVGVRVKFGTVMDNADQVVNVTVGFVNRDTAVVTLPEYRFVLATDGYAFPMTAPSSGQQTALNPLQEKTVSLRTTISSLVSVSNPLLVMMQPAGGAGGETGEAADIPVAVFKLNALGSNAASKSMYVDTANGQYLVTLHAVQRLPWAESDLIVAHFKIRNPSFTKTQPVPNLQGYISIDGITGSAEDVQYIQPDNILTLEPNTTIDGYVVTKLPYYSEYGNLQIVLQEKNGEGPGDVALFVEGSRPTEWTVVSPGQLMEYGTKGKSSTVVVKSLKTYSGSGSNIAYAEVVMESKERRLANLPKLVGFFTTGNDDYYKATVIQQETATLPGGKSLVVLWAKLPRSVNTKDLKLLIGQGVANNKLAAPREEPTAFVNAALFELPPETKEPSKTLIGMDLAPYTLSIRSFDAKLLGGGTVQAEMYYELRRDDTYEFGEIAHRLLLQIVDTATGATMERELSLSELTEGLNRYSFMVSNESIGNKTYGVYTLNVYDVFEGQRRLIGTQSLYYSSSSSI